MQIYTCKICGGNAKHGYTKVHEGVFFKLCQECYEDEAAIRLLNEGLMKYAGNDGSSMQEMSGEDV